MLYIDGKKGLAGKKVTYPLSKFPLARLGSQQDLLIHHVRLCLMSRLIALVDMDSISFVERISSGLKLM